MIYSFSIIQREKNQSTVFFKKKTVKHNENRAALNRNKGCFSRLLELFLQKNKLRKRNLYFGHKIKPYLVCM